MHRISGSKRLAIALFATLAVSLGGRCAESEPSEPLQHPIISFHLRAKGETWARKFTRFRKELLASGAKNIPPLYLSAELAALVVEPIKPMGATSIPGLVPLEESPEGQFSFDASLKYIADLFGLTIQRTEHGCLIDLPHPEKTIAPQ